MTATDIARRYRIEDGKSFRLKDIEPGDAAGLDLNKGDAKDLLQDGVKALSKWQEKLYADDRWPLLLIFQAMDAAGKDGAIEHVMSGVNPQGCMVTSFKVPSAPELDHDFLWRTTKALPERGRIGIFNRSYYEEVLVVRVHPKILDGQKLPEGLVTDRIWQERYESIRDFETQIVRSEPEALLLEGRMIKEFRPRYNVSFRDDKRFLMVKVDLKED